MTRIILLSLLAGLAQAPLHARPTFPLLNEVFASSLSTTNEGNTNRVDWIEVHNPTAAPFDLSDFSLSDRSETPRRWVFPEGTLLPPDGYLVVNFDSVSPPRTNAPFNTGFGLRSTGDRVMLFGPAGGGSVALDAIEFGLQIPEHSIGRLAGTNRWALTALTPGGPNAPVPLGDPTRLRINEWMANPASSDDWFEICNPNDEPVSLGGLRLSDNLAPVAPYRIPDLSFVGTDGDGHALFQADNSVAKGADHTNFKLNNGGEFILLAGADGTVLDAVAFGPQLVGISQGRFPDGSTNIVFLQDNATPGKPNFRPLRGIYVSEALSHADDPVEDSIELHNQTSASLHVGGWFVSDNINKPKKYRIPYGTVIDPGRFLVIYRYQFQPRPGVPPSFAFNSAHGDEVYLFTADPDGNLSGYRTAVTFAAAPNGIPFARHMASTGPQFPLVNRITMGAPVEVTDPPERTPVFRSGQGASNDYPVVGPVVLSEIHYHPPDIGTNDNQLDEFVELHSIVATNLPLYDPNYPSNYWRLSGAVDYTFSARASIPAGATLLVVSFDPATNETQTLEFRLRHNVPDDAALYGPYRGKLDNSAESLELYRPDIPQFCFDPDFGYVAYILVDKVDYADHSPWPAAADGIGLSLHRRALEEHGNDPVNWVAGEPSPGTITEVPAGPLPHISVEDPSPRVAAGRDTTLQVAPAPGQRYQWRFNGNLIPGATNHGYRLPDTQSEDAGLYSVLVSNPYGATNGAFHLTVERPPDITLQPRDELVPRGGVAIFPVAAAGTPPFSYQWARNGVALDGATNATLILSNVQPADAAAYTVTLRTPAGEVTSAPGRLSLASDQPPAIVTSPRGNFYASTTALWPGTRYRLHVVASGEPPLRHQWWKDGAPLDGATGPELVLEDFGPEQAGSYTVEICNEFGCVQSAPVRFGVLELPQIALPPKVVVDPGQPLALSATVTGTPRRYFQWQRNGTNLVGELCADLIRPDLTHADAGLYQLISYNAAGTNRSRTVEVIVRPRLRGVQLAGTKAQITFEGEPNAHFSLESSTDLATWRSVSVVQNDAVISGVVHADVPPGACYYRIVQLPGKP